MGSDQLPCVGFIGVGVMGKPMARNLLQAGYPLIVFDTVGAAADEVVDLGASRGEGPREVALTCDVLITMLPDSADVEAVFLGADGAIQGARQGWLAIDMSSISPRVARELSARVEAVGAEMLDAPVSGGDKGAIAGTLSIMVGGTGAAFSRALPILQVLGKTIVHVGPAGAGQIVKICNQVVVAVVIEAVSEALVLGAKAGVDPERIVEVLQGGLAATRVLEMRSPNILGGRFDPGFRVRLHLKDLRNALDLAREAGVIVPVTAEVEQLMQRLRVAGRGDCDHSGLVTVLEDLAGIRVCDAAASAAAVSQGTA
jgi:2-hydroxy-3-oxopropionate reductase